MSFEWRTADEGSHELVLKDAPANCHVLRMAPHAIEPELQHGRWLILVAAVWSGPDHLAINLAIAAAKVLGDSAQIGIRPYSDSHETLVWMSNVEKHHQSPLWLALHDGRVTKQVIGLPRSVRELLQWLELEAAVKPSKSD